MTTKSLPIHIRAIAAMAQSELALAKAARRKALEGVGPTPYCDGGRDPELADRVGPCRLAELVLRGLELLGGPAVMLSGLDLDGLGDIPNLGCRLCTSGGSGITAEDITTMRMYLDAALRDGSDELDAATRGRLARALLPAVAHWSRLALACLHPERARALLLEATLLEICHLGGQNEHADQLAWAWEQAFAEAELTGHLLVGRMAYDRLSVRAEHERRHEYAAYLAARLAVLAKRVEDDQVAAEARLDEAAYWDSAGELQAAFEAAQMGLDHACRADDRPQVTRALLLSGQLATRGGIAQIAEDAFRGALDSLSQNAASPQLFARARFGLATVAARADRWREAFSHLDEARLDALEAGDLPFYARAVLAARDVANHLDDVCDEWLNRARRDATATFGPAAAQLFRGDDRLADSSQR